MTRLASVIGSIRSGPVSSGLAWGDPGRGTTVNEHRSALPPNGNPLADSDQTQIGFYRGETEHGSIRVHVVDQGPNGERRADCHYGIGHILQARKFDTDGCLFSTGNCQIEVNRSDSICIRDNLDFHQICGNLIQFGFGMDGGGDGSPECSAGFFAFKLATTSNIAGETSVWRWPTFHAPDSRR